MSYQPAVVNTDDEYKVQAQPYILREDEKIPLFLIKLWNIVEDPSYYEIIRWDEVCDFFFTLVSDNRWVSVRL